MEIEPHLLFLTVKQGHPSSDQACGPLPVLADQPEGPSSEKKTSSNDKEKKKEMNTYLGGSLNFDIAWGFQSVSNMITVSAAWRLTPTPPARMLQEKRVKKLTAYSTVLVCETNALYWTTIKKLQEQFKDENIE